MLCEWCDKKLTEKQIKNGNRFCGYSCSNKWAADQRAIPAEVRFWNFVDKSGDCWVWTGGTDKDGYGVFNARTKRYTKAHRFVYRLAYGQIPKGKIICHHCDNPSCVNPEHIYLGTYKTNAQDMARRGRMKKQNGTDNHAAVLNWEKVRKIREMWQSGKYTQKAIADYFNVSRGCITGIIYNVNWKE